MTTLRLYRVTLKTRGGLTVFWRRPAVDGLPGYWTRNPDLAELLSPRMALEVVCSLRRRKQPARLERCDETITD
jgi:hypothetical protein